ncbi:ATP-binding protein [Tianweitania sediminis]|uniref:histidine kinase n=1 Tax=Tianweitania sediminis TaxID=1502156 RepID=A0A8J7QYP7_9HYPH|nr:ATP-binding protein [Tianweitania sediminis]MBP0437687.1 HAMP domain-containing protein [Tianweitania sediminis]
MSKRFRGGSIRRQIAAVALGPIICLVVLSEISDWLLREDLESVSYARATASKIESVVDLVRASTAPGQKAAILDASSRTGLRVEEVGVAELQQSTPNIPSADLRHVVQENLPAGFPTSLRSETATGSLRDVLVVGIGEDQALAFLPAPPPPDAWISDQEVIIVLKLMILVLPVALLSLYAARVIASPLLEFARAAEALKIDEEPDRPFKESGAAEIRTLAKSLNDMRSRLRHMIDDRTRMLRAISHDLRTPLTRLRLRVERSTQPELKAAMLKDISSLSDMIDDTLTYLSKEMASETLVDADLPSLLATVCSDFSDLGFNVTYAGADRFTYRCKPRSLARAVANLVENSTKFAGNSLVELTVLANGAVRISVIDDGPGLRDTVRTLVLEPFFKADPARTPASRTGFGLGLSIVDDIVRAHGGTIELLNRVPHGLVAQIELPAAGDVANDAGSDASTRKVVRAG